MNGAVVLVSAAGARVGRGRRATSQHLASCRVCQAGEAVLLRRPLGVPSTRACECPCLALPRCSSHGHRVSYVGDTWLYILSALLLTFFSRRMKFYMILQNGKQRQHSDPFPAVSKPSGATLQETTLTRPVSRCTPHPHSLAPA